MEMLLATQMIQSLPDGSMAGWVDGWLGVVTQGMSIELKPAPPLTGGDTE